MASVRNTLLVRHLPAELNPEEKESLLRHFGAQAVHCFTGKGHLANAAFATFNNDAEAERALHSLHQLEVLDSYLSVEYARHHDANYFPHRSDFPKPRKVDDGKAALKKPSVEKRLEEFYHKISGLSRSFGLLYPINPKLRYRYPPSNPAIVANIAHALLMVPRFYTQVLHLMNKMNLPAPFDVVTPAPVQRRSYSATRQPSTEEFRRASSEESEISSDDEAPTKPKEQLVMKRPKKNPMAESLKRPRLQQIPPPPSSRAHAGDKEHAGVYPSEVFDTVENLPAKKIELKISTSTLETDPNLAQSSTANENEPAVGTFGQFEPIAKVDIEDTDVEKTTDLKPLTRSELRENRISRDEMKTLPVYKKYNAGEPTSRLYIKNVAKQVDEVDLRMIYLLYVDQHSETEKDMFDVRLMKEGRMKGQAFVNLPSTKKAEMAVKETNGYLLHGKPLVVQFARSAKPKDDTTSK